METSTLLLSRVPVTLPPLPPPLHDAPTHTLPYFPMDCPSPPPDDSAAAGEEVGPTLPTLPSPSLEIRLFYVRLSPCVPSTAPSSLTLTLSHHPPSPIPLRRHPPDPTYVSTHPVRLSGPTEFEVRRGDDVLLCGSLERVEPPWGVGPPGGDPRTGWALGCHAASPGWGTQPPREVEVYVAGCCAGSPLVLTGTVQLGGRRKAGTLDAIPEDTESDTGGGRDLGEGLHCRRPNSQLQVAEDETDDYEAKMSMASGLYSEGSYYAEDGQLSWFNAGVRVGVGLGLGMCIGVGIGVGLLVRSYQATRNTFRRRFF